MSLGLIPVFQPDAAAGFSSLGEALAENLGALEDLARDWNLVPLNAFSDQRQVPEGFEGSPEDLDQLLGPSTDWFDPGEGARAITELADHLRKRRPRQIDELTAVLEELAALAGCLRIAAKLKARFRLTLA